MMRRRKWLQRSRKQGSAGTGADHAGRRRERSLIAEVRVVRVSGSIAHFGLHCHISHAASAALWVSGSGEYKSRGIVCDCRLARWCDGGIHAGVHGSVADVPIPGTQFNPVPKSAGAVHCRYCWTLHSADNFNLLSVGEFTNTVAREVRDWRAIDVGNRPVRWHMNRTVSRLCRRCGRSPTITAIAIVIMMNCDPRSDDRRSGGNHGGPYRYVRRSSSS
jgi:hypothetical protein